jgi:hypothetical protein
MALHQLERLIELPSAERIKNEDLIALLKSEDLIDPIQRKKTVYLLGGKVIHAHEITSEVTSEEDGKKSYLVTWSDREKYNDLDIAIQLKYFPENDEFCCISTSEDSRESLIERDQYIKHREDIINDIQRLIAKTISVENINHSPFATQLQN